MLSLDYDIDKLIEEYRKSDLMVKARVYAKIIQQSLRTGHNYLTDVLTNIETLLKADDAYADADDIPDMYWEEAYRQIMKEDA